TILITRVEYAEQSPHRFGITGLLLTDHASILRHATSGSPSHRTRRGQVLRSSENGRRPEPATLHGHRRRNLPHAFDRREARPADGNDFSRWPRVRDDDAPSVRT